MSKSLFRYSKIDQSSSVIVKQRTSEIKSLMRKTAQGIVEIGHKLIEVKEELPHGEFGNWLEAEFGWSHSTARRYINVADKFSNLKNLDIGSSALYLLAENTTPDEARKEALDRAEQGESISHSTAKEITDNHKDTSNIGNRSEKGVSEIADEVSNRHRKSLDKLADDVDPETGEVFDSAKEKTFENHKETFTELDKDKNSPRMDDYNSTDQDICPMCGQSWPDH